MIKWTNHSCVWNKGWISWILCSNSAYVMTRLDCSLFHVRVPFLFCQLDGRHLCLERKFKSDTEVKVLFPKLVPMKYIIMNSHSAMTTINHLISLFNHLFRQKFKAPQYCLVWGSPLVADGLPSQKAGSAKSFQCHDIIMSVQLTLTHWGRHKIAAIFQTSFSNECSWMKMFKFWKKFHWKLFPRVQ